MHTITAPDGALYLPGSAVRHRPGYADVDGALLAKWRDAGHLRPVTRGELAAAMRVTLPAGVDPEQPAMWPGTTGAEYVYRWADVERAERVTRMTRRRRGGRGRGTSSSPPAGDAPRVCPAA